MTTQVITPHVDRAVMGLGVLYPLAALPQVYNVWFLHRTAGFNEFTYLVGVIVAILWVSYGFLHRQRAVWMVNSLWVALNGAMAVGLFFVR
ncbi:MAG: hypothetical protein Kow0067_01370 [Coriobacteriia bacterium]